MRFQKHFGVGKASYTFNVYYDYEIMFAVEVADDWEWGEIEHSTMNEGGASNPVAVFRKAFSLLKTYIYEAYPPYFTFTAQDEKRRKVYEVMVPRIERLTSYKCAGASVTGFGVQFLFIKRKKV